MIAREGLIKKISEKLAHLTNVVKIQNKQGLFDINKSAEDLFVGLLNLAFDMQLSNENRIRSNYPAIDLSDRKNRVCFQITSQTSNQKIRETLEKFEAGGLKNYFDTFVFLIISVELKPTCTIPSYVRVINVSDLGEKISKECEDSLLSRILSFLDLQIGTISHQNTILPSNIVQTYFNPSNPDLLIDCLRYTEFDEQHINNLIVDLKSLSLKLSELTQNQREYLYYVVERGRIYQNCGGPVSIVAANLYQTFGQAGFDIFQVLQSEDLLDIDYEFQIDDRNATIVFAKYLGISDDINLFSEFKIHFPQCLHSIIVDVNFSCLSSQK